MELLQVLTVIAQLCMTSDNNSADSRAKSSDCQIKMVKCYDSTANKFSGLSDTRHFSAIKACVLAGHTK